MERTYKEVLNEVKEHLNSVVLVGERITRGSVTELKVKVKEGIGTYIRDHGITLDSFTTQDNLIKALVDELLEYGFFTDLLSDRDIMEIQCLTPGTITYSQKLMNIHGIPYHGHRTVYDPNATEETLGRVIMKFLGGEQLTNQNPIQVVDNKDLGFIITAIYPDFTASGNYALKLVRKV